MRIHITDEQLAANIRSTLALRGSCGDPEKPNLIFQPVLERCDSAARSARYRVHTYPWMSNPFGVVHGGVTATLVDSFMGVLSRSLYCTEAPTPTITMTVNYALPIPLDRDIIVHVRATHTGSTTTQMIAEVFLPDDPNTTLATATGAYYVANRH